MAELTPFGRGGFSTRRVFDAPRERVWREWTEPAAFADWFGGPDGEVPLDSLSMDVRPGGAWRATMFGGPRRQEIHWAGEYQVVEEPERLVLTITDREDLGRFDVLTIELADLGDGRTEMRFEQRGWMGPEGYERAGAGWSVFFDRVDEHLTAG